ncbi:DUF4129 domain-containing protein [Hahella ganghwensis]|uniref:DUF4129 domain-containing protein n=1 Tax=Hahella ganghwensis TaxID=286420 RepID=UPI0003678B5C|nr:DUF4129 domain-containing protein [Hahella ganghwensis]
MNPSNIVFRLRARSAHEAVDLGFKFARRWWLLLIKLWICVTLPPFLIGLMVFDNASYAITILWWWLPLWERPQLFVLSRAVFGETPSLKQALRATPGLLWRQSFASLTWRRLSPSRSFDLPVLQLEGLKGRSRSQRLSVLHRDQAGSVAFWLTIVGAHVVALFMAGLVGLLYMLLPDNFTISWKTLMDADLLWAMTGYVAMALIGPFYVAGGFGLYLNRRVVLEGWDLELAFRQLAAKCHPEQDSATGHKRKTSGVVNVLLAVSLAMGIFTGVTPDSAWAEAGEDNIVENDSPYTPDQAKEDIQEILAGPDFRRTKVSQVPRFWRDWLESDSEETQEDITPPDWLLWLGVNLAKVFQALAWLIIIFAVIYVIYRNRDALLAAIGHSGTFKSRPAPARVMNMDIRESSLPDSILDAVEALWQKGSQREALALLYRATISRLVNRFSLRFPPGATEGDCLRSVRHLNQEDIFSYFSRLTRSWQALAYAHRVPSEEEFQALCQHWGGLFEVAGQQQSGGQHAP